MRGVLPLNDEAKEKILLVWLIGSAIAVFILSALCFVSTFFMWWPFAVAISIVFTGCITEHLLTGNRLDWMKRTVPLENGNVTKKLKRNIFWTWVMCGVISMSCSIIVLLIID